MPETIAATGEVSSGFRFSWGLAFAGGVAATAVTFFLLMLGSGFGLLLVNPVKHGASSLPAFLTGGAIYFFAAQAFGFAVGGHIAGRLLGTQIESRIQEEVRAAIHGLVVWAVTILTSLTIIVFAGLAALGGGMAVASLYGAHAPGSSALSASYIIDGLFWPNVAGATDTGYGNGYGGAALSVGARAEATRILQAGLMRGEQLGQSDRDRLVYLVASEARIPLSQAGERVDRMQSDVQSKTRDAADRARKAASYASLWIGFSLLFGAIVSVFAAISARFEDDREAWNPLTTLRDRFRPSYQRPL